MVIAITVVVTMQSKSKECSMYPEAWLHAFKLGSDSWTWNKLWFSLGVTQNNFMEPVQVKPLIMTSAWKYQFPVQLLIKAFWKAVEYGTSTWLLANHMEYQDGFLGLWLQPGSVLAIVAICRVSQQMEDYPPLSFLSHPLPLAQIDTFSQKKFFFNYLVNDLE